MSRPTQEELDREFLQDRLFNIEILLERIEALLKCIAGKEEENEPADDS